MAPIPGNVVAEQFLLVENGAGVYTASVTIPPYARILDITVDALALWAAGTSAELIVGDDSDPDCFYTGVNLKATDMTAGQALSFTMAGGQEGAFIVDAAVVGSQNLNLTRATTRTLTAACTSVGVGTTGRTLVTFLYVLPYWSIVSQ